MDIKNLIDRICEDYNPSLEEIAAIFDSSDDEIEYLFQAADRIREKYCGNEVQIRGIIEFSNYCRAKCKYCGINAENSDTARFRMPVQEIIQYAKEAHGAGYRTLVLQSGEDLHYTREMISDIIKGIKSIDDIAITLSVGERDYEDYKQWKDDGADRFLMKQETADEELYNKLHPHSTFKKRLQCLYWLKELGYQVGSGFMIGLPGQTSMTIARDIKLLKELDVDMAGIGPFISHPKTTLAGNPSGSTFNTLKAVALARIVVKTVHLPATTALGVVKADDKSRVFSCGANVIMQKVEPYAYRKMYQIYPNNTIKDSAVKDERINLENYIKSLGREISDSRGDTLKINGGKI